MTIVSARRMNHGAYRCVASNPFGITHTIVSLIIKGKTDTFSHFSCHTLPKPSREGFPLVFEQIPNHFSILTLASQSLLWLL